MRPFLFVLCFIWSGVIWTQDSLLHTTQVSILSCDPGSDLYSTFGHTAIRVFDHQRGIDQVFNYGTFDFQTPNFYLKFMRGKLPYRLSVTSYANFLQEYNHFQRGVREQLLFLDDVQRVILIKALIENAKPENAEYAYDFFFDNCSSRVRDMIIKNVGSPVSFDTAGKNLELTFRDMLHQYLTAMPWTAYGIDLIIGRKADAKASLMDQMFLPDYLHDHFVHAKIEGDSIRTLCADSYKVLIFDDELKARQQPSWFSPWVVYFYLMLMFGILWYARQFKYLGLSLKAVYIINGIAGLIMLIMWFGTEHQATKDNWNFIWASPLYFWLAFGSGSRGKSILAAVLAVCSAVYLAIAWSPFAFQDAETVTPHILFNIIASVIGMLYEKRQVEPTFED